MSELEQAIAELKNRIQSEKEESAKRSEYEQLKQDLAEITQRTLHEPRDLDGGMQMPDMDKVLKTKRQKQTFSEIVMSRIVRMCSLRPIIGNLIALVISILGLSFIFGKVDLAGFESYRYWLVYGGVISIGMTILKSASRSIVLPLAAVLFGSTVASTLSQGHLFWHFGKSYYEGLMLLGAVGLFISAMAID